MNTILLSDMAGNKFTENDFVIFADSYMALRIARVRGIKKLDGSNNHMVALEVIAGLTVGKRRYSRMYHEADFYKIDYVSTGDDSSFS